MCGIFNHRQQEFLNLHPQLGWTLLEPTLCYLTQFHGNPFWKTSVSFRLPIVCLKAPISLSQTFRSFKTVLEDIITVLWNNVEYNVLCNAKLSSLYWISSNILFLCHYFRNMIYSRTNLVCSNDEVSLWESLNHFKFLTTFNFLWHIFM